MFSAAKFNFEYFCFQDNQIVKKLILKGCNRSISYVTMFFQHKKQCDEINETISTLLVKSKF